MKIHEEHQRWINETLNPAIERFPVRKSVFSTPSGFELPPIDVPDEIDYMKDIGFPGEFPYTRGIQPTMYRSRLWTMRQYAGYASAEESNARFKYLLEQGQTGLSIAFDLPTQIGYDADDELSLGEVGKVGVSISSIVDMEALFKDIPLDKVSTSMTINAPAAILLAMYIVIARRRGISEKNLRGTIQNDILKEYVARGTYIFPPVPSMRLITDVLSYCMDKLPNWNAISISGYHIREAGSTAVQEVAFTLANAIAYVNAAINAGMDVDDFASRISFFFNAHNNLLEEVAKYRAARRLWARIMKERFGAKKPQSLMLRFHTQTAGSTLTAQQPENNIIRVTIQALAAILGGSQSLHTNSKDEALWLPTEKSVRTALRTQQVIAYESGVADIIDPLAGSYLLERLTNQIEAHACEYIEKIDRIGGVLAAIEKGYIQSEIQEAAYKYQKKIEEKDITVVGVNAFETGEPVDMEYLKVNPAIETQQQHKLEQLRTSRNGARVNELLNHLRVASKSNENLMPILIQCVDGNITLGEICRVLRDAWGEYHTPASY